MRIRLILATILTASLGGCLSEAPAPVVTPMATNTGVCAALARDMPVRVHSSTTDAESQANVARANAAYRQACP